MRLLLLLGWLLLPVGFLVWHRGPGQVRVRSEKAGKVLAQADRHAAAGEWADAIKGYDEALRLLPAEKVEAARSVRLARARAQMQNKQLLAAHDGLKALCAEMQADPKADRALLAQARSALAQSHYYVTWLMRLRGSPSEEWGPEIESARQAYRLLAEQAGERGDEKARRRHEEDLEAAVRLARMSLEELAGQPVPAQVRGAGGKKVARIKGPSPSQGSKPPADARGASSGPPPDTGGH
jgi:hypothetical protein